MRKIGAAGSPRPREPAWGSRTSCKSFMNLSIVSSAFCGCRGMVRVGMESVRSGSGGTRTRDRAHFVYSMSIRVTSLSAPRGGHTQRTTHLAGNGKGTVHVEQHQGLPGLLALRHGTKRVCVACDAKVLKGLLLSLQQTAASPGPPTPSFGCRGTDRHGEDRGKMVTLCKKRRLNPCEEPPLWMPGWIRKRKRNLVFRGPTHELRPNHSPGRSPTRTRSHSSHSTSRPYPIHPFRQHEHPGVHRGARPRQEGRGCDQRRGQGQGA